MLPVKTGSVPYPFEKGSEWCQLRLAAFRTLFKRVEIVWCAPNFGISSEPKGEILLCMNELENMRAAPSGKNRSKIDILIGFRKSWKSLLILWDECTGSFSWEYPYIFILHGQVRTGQYLCFTGQGNQRLPVLESFQIENGVPCLGRGHSENRMLVIRDDAKFRKKKDWAKAFLSKKNYGARLFRRKNLRRQELFWNKRGGKQFLTSDNDGARTFLTRKRWANTFPTKKMKGLWLFWRKNEWARTLLGVLKIPTATLCSNKFCFVPKSWPSIPYLLWRGHMARGEIKCSATQNWLGPK